MRYEIVQTVSGVILGEYEGGNVNEALDALAKDQGYMNYDNLLNVTGETRESDTIEVTEII